MVDHVTILLIKNIRSPGNDIHMCRLYFKCKCQMALDNILWSLEKI